MIVLENGLKVYRIEEINDIRDLKAIDKNSGYVYVLKYISEESDREIIKIGVSRNPYSRISHFVKSLDNYSFARIEKFALTDLHYDYYNSESTLHRYYRIERKQNTELFYIGFDEVCEKIYDIIKIEPIENKISSKIEVVEEEEVESEYDFEEIEEEYNMSKMEMAISLKIARDCGLSCMALYNIIFSHKVSNNPHGCYPSYETIMDECCIGSKSTLTSNLNKLCDYGYLVIKSGNRGSCNQYYFPLASRTITNYTDADLRYISKIKRKVGHSNNTMNSNSLKNLKNHKE